MDPHEENAMTDDASSGSAAWSEPAQEAGRPRKKRRQDTTERAQQELVELGI
jgi:hypothetical protein